MDTISRENSPSVLPIAGVIVGALALILSIVALVKISGLNKKVTEDLANFGGQISSMQSSVQGATDTANKANTGISNLQRATQQAVDTISTEINNIKVEMNKLVTAKAAPAPKEKGAKGAKGAAADEGAPAGPGGDYAVKAGDTLNKIAKAHGVSLSALEAANPGVDSRRLKIGQKLAIPGGR
jgi:LysM repeat protein